MFIFIVYLSEILLFEDIFCVFVAAEVVCDTVTLQTDRTSRAEQIWLHSASCVFLCAG